MNNKPRKPDTLHQGTAKISVTGSEAALFDIVVENNHPDSTDEIICCVLTQVADETTGESKLSEKLEILEIECLTKP